MNTHVVYKPAVERIPDHQYKDLLREIRDNGEWYPNQMDEPAKTIFGYKLKYPLANGAPIITERDTVTRNARGRSHFSQAVGEMIGFMNGAHTQEQLETFGCFWWKNWVNKVKCAKRGLETGDLGPGSYGSAWTEFPTADGTFNQITAVIAQIKENPQLRTHVLSPWVPQHTFRAKGYQQKVVVVPCHGWINVRINTSTGKMTLIHYQRSADVPVGLPANLAGYTAFGLMLASITGYQLDCITFLIGDAHYYKRQKDAVEDLINQPDQILPTVRLNREVTNIADFRETDFEVADYFPSSPRTVISTPT